MKFLKGFFPGLLSLTLLIGYGCASDDDGQGDMIPDPLDNPPAAIEDLSGGAGIDPTGTGKWTQPGEELSSTDPDGWVRLPNIKLPVVYFAFDKYDIGTSEKPKLDKTAEYLKNNQGICLIIEGNCDERGSEEYNRALGERRAISIKDYLQGVGIPSERMKTISYGEEKPADEGHTPEAWAKNRRGDLIAAKPTR
ncbi:MAG: peptidoglycan-associated lipoprotein [Lentisphaerae bacterium GWF2_45_14]|nr:MAG: peptidoglycan-associated lipoprotein [Lentisphaerae bacterium GWF2_45_14]